MTNPPVVDLGSDTTLCPNIMLVLQSGIPASSCQWQDGSTADTFEVNKPGLYYVLKTNSCGNAWDSIIVQYFPAQSFSLGVDTVLCPDDSMLLSISLSNVTWVWQDYSTDSVYVVSSPGMYSATVTDNNECTLTDSVQITYDICDRISEFDPFPGELMIYPNPSTNVVTIDFNTEDSSIVAVSLSDMIGKKIFVRKFNSTFRLPIQLDLSGFSKGFYFWNVETKQGIYNGKIMIR